MSSLLERYEGSLLGLAVGDALGAAVEFKSPGTFTPVTDMRDGGPWNLEAGYWTDDTSMALCLAESLIEKQGFDAKDQMDRYVRWWKQGHLSSIGSCFDIGITTSTSLARYRATGDPFSGPGDPSRAGNGSIMRLAPVPLAFAHNPKRAIELAGESSRTTHGADTCIDACRYLAALIVGALQGEDKQALLSERYTPVPGLWDEQPLHPKIDAIAAGSFKEKEPPAIRGSGYVVESLEAALWAFHNSDSYEEGVLKAINLGDDADTTGAVYGQLAGAYYGVSGIPARWLTKVTQAELLQQFAQGLHELSTASAK